MTRRYHLKVNGQVTETFETRLDAYEYRKKSLENGADISAYSGFWWRNIAENRFEIIDSVGRIPKYDVNIHERDLRIRLGKRTER